MKLNTTEPLASQPPVLKLGITLSSSLIEGFNTGQWQDVDLASSQNHHEQSSSESEMKNTVTEAAKGRHTFEGRWTADLKHHIVLMCVEEKFSPMFLAKKWGCSANSIRVWVKNAGFELPGRYNRNYIHELQLGNETVTVDRTVAQKRSQEEMDSNEGNSMTEKSRKRSKQAQTPFSEEKESMKGTVSITGELDQPKVNSEVQNGNVLFGYAPEEKNNDSVICLSDDDDKDILVIGSTTDANANLMEGEISNGGKELKISSHVENNFDPEKLENECPFLNPGKYTVVSVHLEFFRSSKHAFTKLTQVGCVVQSFVQIQE